MQIGNGKIAHQLNPMWTRHLPPLVDLRRTSPTMECLAYPRGVDITLLPSNHRANHQFVVWEESEVSKVDARVDRCSTTNLPSKLPFISCHRRRLVALGVVSAEMVNKLGEYPFGCVCGIQDAKCCFSLAYFLRRHSRVTPRPFNRVSRACVFVCWDIAGGHEGTCRTIDERPYTFYGKKIYPSGSKNGYAWNLDPVRRSTVPLLADVIWTCMSSCGSCMSKNLIIHVHSNADVFVDLLFIFAISYSFNLFQTTTN